jgi:hypothetical protein
VQPHRARGRLERLDREAWLDEADRQGTRTRQHGGKIGTAQGGVKPHDLAPSPPRRMMRRAVCHQPLRTMPIQNHLKGHRFDPEAIRLMGLALEIAVVALRFAGRRDIASDDVAKKIIALAKAGERDPERMCETAMNELRAVRPPPRV